MKIAKRIIFFTIAISLLGLLPVICFADSLENLKTHESSIVIVNESRLADVKGHGSLIVLSKTNGKIILWDEAVLSMSADARSKRYDGGNTNSSITARCVNVNMYEQSGRR